MKAYVQLILPPDEENSRFTWSSIEAVLNGEDRKVTVNGKLVKPVMLNMTVDLEE